MQNERGCDGWGMQNILGEKINGCRVLVAEPDEEGPI
jgi:hypothetical protein